MDENQTATPVQNGGYLKSNIFTLTIPEVNIWILDSVFLYFFNLVGSFYYDVVYVFQCGF